MLILVFILKFYKDYINLIMKIFSANLLNFVIINTTLYRRVGVPSELQPSQVCIAFVRVSILSHGRHDSISVLTVSSPPLLPVFRQLQTVLCNCITAQMNKFQEFKFRSSNDDNVPERVRMRLRCALLCAASHRSSQHKDKNSIC